MFVGSIIKQLFLFRLKMYFWARKFDGEKILGFTISGCTVRGALLGAGAS